MRPIDVVRRACPRARLSYLTAIENGDALFKKHGITTPLRLAHFLAQICHESGGLEIEWESGAYSSKRLVEVFGVGRHSAGITPAEAVNLAYKADQIFERVYGLGNPTKARALGNTQPGDGFKYRGGGLMQTTGRFNYRTMGQKCGVDFETHPEWVLSSEHALKPALAEWTAGNLNKYADANDIEAISRAINLGNPKSGKTPNGMADRRSWFKKLRPMIDRVDLNADFPAPVAPPARSDAPPPPDSPQKKPAPTAAAEPAKAPSNTTRNATAGVTIGAATAAASQAPSWEWVLAVLFAGAVAAVLVILIWKRKE